MENNLYSLLKKRPRAYAIISGNENFSEIRGSIFFYETAFGIIVRAEIAGLPTENGNCKDKIFGFHIHEGNSCTGTSADPFSDAKSHYNPRNCLHPYHAGDLPPLFGTEGNAISVFLTNRFRLDEIIGRTIIIHSMPDDFTTQPSGNAGEKIACGIINRIL